MTDAELFHNTVLQYGGEFRPEESFPDQGWHLVRKEANHIIDAARAFFPRLPDIYFGFIPNNDINAVSFEKEGRYFIGVFTGIVVTFRCLFCRMLSDRRLFQRIGNIELESDSLQPLCRKADEIINSNLYPPSMPKCPYRATYAEWLLGDVFRFLMVHEIAHILDGHVNYSKSNFGMPFLFEFEKKNTGNDEAMLTRQTWEIDADSQGAMYLTSNAKRLFKDCPPHDIFGYVCRVAFAMCSFFRVFGDSKFMGDEMSDAHPPHRIRQVICMERAMQVAKTWPDWPYSTEESISVFYHAVPETDNIFAGLADDAFTRIGLAEALSEQGKEYRKRLNNHWNVVRPLLKPFAFHDLYEKDIHTYYAGV